MGFSVSPCKYQEFSYIKPGPIISIPFPFYHSTIIHSHSLDSDGGTDGSTTHNKREHNPPTHNTHGHREEFILTTQGTIEDSNFLVQ
jgi:hypothetical protein